MTVLATARALEQTTSALIATLPALPIDELVELAAQARSLAAALRDEPARVADALARVIDQYRDGRALLEGWAVVASASHTLARAIAEPDAGLVAALAAVRFELETLLPAASRPPAVASPDVPLASLYRRT